jgi:hypothetical protein
MLQGTEGFCNNHAFLFIKNIMLYISGLPQTWCTRCQEGCYDWLFSRLIHDFIRLNLLNRGIEHRPPAPLQQWLTCLLPQEHKMATSVLDQSG